MSLSQLYAALKHMSGKHNQKRHGRTTTVDAAGSHFPGEEPWFKQGKDYGIHYHGGKRKIKVIDPEMLNTRDSGYYGRGFYVGGNPEVAGFYGKRTTKVKFKPAAKVLDMGGALSHKQATPELAKAVEDAYFQQSLEIAIPRGREDKVRSQEDFIRQSIRDYNVDWIQAVNIYAQRNNVDILKFSEGETIIRNLDAVEIVK